jgi:hypothetical protein
MKANKKDKSPKASPRNIIPKKPQSIYKDI